MLTGDDVPRVLAGGELLDTTAVMHDTAGVVDGLAGAGNRGNHLRVRSLQQQAKVRMESMVSHD
jgi:hypothetical protein